MSAEQQVGTDENQIAKSPRLPPPPPKPTREEIKSQAQEYFDYFDVDKDGYIEAKEVEDVFRQWNSVEKDIIYFTEEDLKEISAEFIKHGDANADSKVTCDELYNAMLKEWEYDV